MSAGINFVADENEYRGDPEDWNEQSINALGDKHQTWANDNAFPVETPSEFMLQNRTFGLTKREYFAARNLQALIAGYPNEAKAHGCYVPQSEYSEFAKEAVQLADALINQLNK